MSDRAYTNIVPVWAAPYSCAPPRAGAGDGALASPRPSGWGDRRTLTTHGTRRALGAGLLDHWLVWSRRLAAVRSWQWRFVDDESGAELLEWAVVTVILIVATYAILQAVGTEFGAVASTVLSKIRDFVGL